MEPKNTTKPNLLGSKEPKLTILQTTVPTQQQCNQTEFIFSLEKEILREVLEENITCG